MKDPRPDLSEALDRLVDDIPLRVRALSHVRPRAVLLVAGQAHETSRATIRSLLGEARGHVKVGAHLRRYEVTLRPLFFLSANGLGRLVTLFHELFHIGPRCDGALDEDRRHRGRADSFDAHVEALARHYAERANEALLAPLGHDGEVLMRQWRVRPGMNDGRRYGDAHVFMGPVVMRTPKAERTVWW